MVIHTVKGFGIVNKAETDVFLELFAFFHDPAGVAKVLSTTVYFSWNSFVNFSNLRSQLDINNKKNVSDSFSDEYAFLQKKYPSRLIEMEQSILPGL